MPGAWGRRTNGGCQSLSVALAGGKGVTENGSRTAIRSRSRPRGPRGPRPQAPDARTRAEERGWDGERTAAHAIRGPVHPVGPSRLVTAHPQLRWAQNSVPEGPGDRRRRAVALLPPAPRRVPVVPQCVPAPACSGRQPCGSAFPWEDEGRRSGRRPRRRAHGAQSSGPWGQQGPPRGQRDPGGPGPDPRAHGSQPAGRRGRWHPEHWGLGGGSAPGFGQGLRVRRGLAAPPGEGGLCFQKVPAPQHQAAL